MYSLTASLGEQKLFLLLQLQPFQAHNHGAYADLFPRCPSGLGITVTGNKLVKLLSVDPAK